ncbi:fungal-specific transcription factor domain-containing protein [Colletotrichum somersetense]|nr:fungal-specific transcription factor domain-containing protein [Colletotrichum somersetense]
MVFNIAAIVKVRSRVYKFSPERFYRAALHFSRDCFSQISFPSIQALVTLIIHSMLTPGEVNLFTLVHIGLAHCIELGIHREPPPAGDPNDVKNQQIRRLAFFTIYSLDRSVSSIQGRPLGFRDETFDIKMPELRSQRRLSPTSSPMFSSFSAAVLQFARFQFELDRIVSDVKVQFYHLPCGPAWFALLADPQNQQTRIKDELLRWWKRVAEEPFNFPGLDNRQRRMWQLKLKIKHHTTMIMLFQPSQAIRNPPPESLQICFNNASSIIQDYQTLHDLQGLHHGWATVQNIFAAGATLIYSFWTCSAVRNNASMADLSRSLRACSGLLAVGGEWWPSIKEGQRSFSAIADLTIRKLYTSNMPSKNPRLFTPLTSEGVQDAVEQSEGVPDYDLTGQQDISRAALNGTHESWPHSPGATVGLPHPQDSVHWHGAYPDGSFQSGTDDYIPEIENFLADFGKSEFSWSIPMAGVGDSCESGNFQIHVDIDCKGNSQYGSK